MDPDEIINNGIALAPVRNTARGLTFNFELRFSSRSAPAAVTAMEAWRADRLSERINRNRNLIVALSVISSMYVIENKTAAKRLYEAIHSCTGLTKVRLQDLTLRNAEHDTEFFRQILTLPSLQRLKVEFSEPEDARAALSNFSTGIEDLALAFSAASNLRSVWWNCPPTSVTNAIASYGKFRELELILFPLQLDQAAHVMKENHHLRVLRIDMWDSCKDVMDGSGVVQALVENYTLQEFTFVCSSCRVFSEECQAKITEKIKDLKSALTDIRIQRDSLAGKPEDIDNFDTTLSLYLRLNELGRRSVTLLGNSPTNQQQRINLLVAVFQNLDYGPGSFYLTNCIFILLMEWVGDLFCGVSSIEYRHHAAKRCKHFHR